MKAVARAVPVAGDAARGRRTPRNARPARPSGAPARDAAGLEPTPSWRPCGPLGDRGARCRGAVHHDKVRGYIGFPSVRALRTSPGCRKPSQNLPLAL